MPVPGRRLLHARVLDRKLGVGVATQVRPVNVLEHTKVDIELDPQPELKACPNFLTGTTREMFSQCGFFLFTIAYYVVSNS